MTPHRRQAIIGVLTVIVLIAAFVLAWRARRYNDVPFVVVAPVGTVVTLDGLKPRVLRNQPNTSSTLASFYFLTDAGPHQVRFQEPGKSSHEQSVAIEASRLPVIYTLLRDTLRPVAPRTRE
jgi:hypothetical protein